MNNEAWNKITQTHDLFKKIIAPLKQHLNINFGYMIVFNDGSYYQIIEDLECLKKWVTNVETSHIFCARNVTTYFDEPYNFTIWPEEPTCPAMEIYKEYGIWNGITVSKMGKDYTELYWFTKESAENGWHKWFIRNKQLLLKCIVFFEKYKKSLFVLGDPRQELFRFKKVFNLDILNSEYIKNELSLVNGIINSFKLNPLVTKEFQETIELSPRQYELLSLICQGYTTKMVALEMSITLKTAEHYIERIKQKTGFNFKTDLIKFYKNYF